MTKNILYAIPILNFVTAIVDISNYGKNWDVGHTPKQLSKYINKKISTTAYLNLRCFGVYTSYKGYNFWDDCKDNIMRDIKLNLPRIILLIYGGGSMHYVNIVGYKKADNSFVILDTDKDLYVISNANLKYWMNGKGYIIVILIQIMLITLLNFFHNFNFYK